MNPLRKILPLLVTGLVVLMNLSGAALAYQPPEPAPLGADALLADPPPHTPVLVWGTVKVDDKVPPLGTVVAAWIAGVKCAEIGTVANQTDQIYGFNIPDNNHLNVAACAYSAGKEVTFTVGSAQAKEKLTYTTAVVYQHNITATAPVSVSVHGTVKVNGKNPAVGTKVAAMISGVKCAETATVTDQSNQVYSFNIPDAAHLSVAACAYGAGKEVTFMVGTDPAKEKLTYTTALTYEHNITVGYPVFLPFISLGTIH